MQSILLALLLSAASLPALDQNANLQSDIWEVHYGAIGLIATADTDRDGFTNATENAAGTNPLDSTSRPLMEMLPGSAGNVNASWPSEPGKLYGLYGSQALAPGSWTLLGTTSGDGTTMLEDVATNGADQWFFKLQSQDQDSDGDLLSDWEEYRIGFNPFSQHSDRNDTIDLTRVTSGMNANAASTVITVGLIDGDMREDWPDKGVIAIRRTGNFKPMWISFTATGTATPGTDYTLTNSSQVYFPFGARETWIELAPVNDASVEGPETAIITVTAGTGYTVGVPNSATATMNDASALPSAKASARFLLQAGFGPDQDSAGDADIIPENVEEVMAVGFDAWINDQFTRPLGLLQPFTAWAETFGNGIGLYGNYKEFSWWHRAMGVPKLRPDDVGTQLPDILRQRVAFALSEILVAADRPEALAVEGQGMANYYDKLVTHAFGNYKNLLYDVATHPVMGVYLSHLNNQKADPVNKIYPDENFAREIMQLFSIGLWELEDNGTRKTHPVGHPQAGQLIPTYTNADITELARVFTGMTFADKNFPGTNGDYKLQMKMWDANHDCNAKTLLGGLALPARTPSPGNTGTAGLLDVDAAVTNLFNHPSVGPFVGRQLIQRLVTSNPSAAYIGRVTAAFNGTNPVGPRGDMKAVVKAILLDPEARDPAMMEQPTWGKLREPFLRVVNFARAFNAYSTSGYYPLDQFTLDHMQDPMNAPSVFNFFMPGHSPPGPVTQAGLVAPEFQIINASTAITGPNYFWNAIGGNNLHRWGSTAQYAVRLNSDVELAMVVPAANINQTTPSESLLMDSDPLLRRLDMTLTGGTLTPRQFQIIRESIDRVRPSGGTSHNWHRERLRLAIYLIVTSAEFNVQR